MKTVVLSGYYGFDNAGDEAVCKSIISDLRALDPQLNIVVLSNQPEKTALTYQVSAVNRWKLLLILKTLKNTDLLISGGGSLLQDVSSKYGLYYYLAIILFAKLLKKPTMIYAQGLGPINLPFNRHISGLILKHVNQATFRDKESQALFESLGNNMPKSELVFDPVLGYTNKVDREMFVKDPHKKTLIFALRGWKNLSPSLFSHAIDALSEEYQILLLPLHLGSDDSFAKLIQKECQSPVEILKGNYTIDELMAIFSQADATIAMRLHGLIMAAAQKKPLLALSYDPKCASFMHMIGNPNSIDLDILTTENLIYHIKHHLFTAQTYQENLANYQQSAHESARIALNLLK